MSVPKTTRDRALAQDIIQTTWLKAIQALPRFRQRGTSISAWLFAIARNELRQHWRRSQREVPFDPAEHDTPTGSQKELEDKILIEQALAHLCQDDRELIRLRYIADLPLKDISQKL